MRKRHSLAVLAGVTTMIMLGQAEAVQAVPPPGCSWESHCYSTMRWEHFDVSGAEVELGVYSSYVPGPDAAFETTEMWVGFDGDPISWVEAGVIRGVGGIFCEGTHYFSAASYPGPGFQIRCHGTAPLNTKVMLKAQENTSGNWTWYLNGTALTTYSNTPKTTSFLEIGNEYTRSDIQSSMTGGKLKYRTSAAPQTWKSGWNSASYPAPSDNRGGSPCYTIWVAKPTDMRARCNIPALAAAPSVHTVKALPAQSTMNKALRIAALSGVRSPSGVQMTDSTGADVSAALRTDIEAGRAVTVIRMEGDFTAQAVPRPRGASAPTGNVMTLVFDKLSGELQTMSLVTQ